MRSFAVYAAQDDGEDFQLSIQHSTSNIQHSPSRRVAITGIGIVSCFGRGQEAALASLRSATSGVRRITSIDASALNCRVAGEVPAEAHHGLFPGYDRFTRFALIAAEEAAAQARLSDAGVNPVRIGVIIGTGLGGCETLDNGYLRLYAQSATRLPPTMIPSSMYNAASSAVATRFQAKGLSYAIVSACASSAHSIGQAALAIRGGIADVVLAGGADAPLTLGIIRAWEGLRVLAVDNDHPAASCRPFSADRKGLVLAEGAAVMVLEEWENALRRGVTILGEIAGTGMTSDAGHITDPSSDGATRAMRLALDDGGIDVAEVGYINAHGTGTRANDATETKAIRAVFGDRAGSIPVSSTKSLHGHAMGASGAIEIACSILALRAGFLPPTINLIAPDPECDLDYVPNEPREARVSLCLSNSFAFGGMNGVVAVRVFGLSS
ncbi:MAG TPA: beta-ketoacyl-[acyl-carrier-protein] synthase family protein [Thermoanaerobaculia bacterium]|nr:beta-ketoacyl-[acyl-carrier-protein] synthase family protein [Thermoanaerobaculia bacterium]